MRSPDGRLTGDPHKIADNLWRQHRPWWVIWFGSYTNRFWAIAAWVPGTSGVIEQPTPDALIAAMNNLETIYPKPH